MYVEHIVSEEQFKRAWDILFGDLDENNHVKPDRVEEFANAVGLQNDSTEVCHLLRSSVSSDKGWWNYKIFTGTGSWNFTAA